MYRFKTLAALSLASSATVAVATTAWDTTGPMTVARANATATMLPNGSVLVAGGKAGIGPAFPVLASAELYDPATGGWSSTGTMNLQRQIATATLLTDGRVLVVGGRPSSGVSTATAELYDPKSGTWSYTGSMSTPRVRHSAALLPDGRVLVTGGLDDTAPRGQVFLKSAEVYDPPSGRWSSVESMSINRYGFPLITLSDGRLLAIGGASSAGDFVFNRSAEIFDPATGHWTRAHDMSQGRGFAPATRLADGRVLIAGGSTHEGSLLGNVQTDSAEIYDPANGRWTLTGAMITRRTAALAVTLDDGRVLVAGGNQYDLKGSGINLSVVDREALSTSEIWDASTNVWTSGGPMSEGRTAFMLVKLSSGAVLTAGGNGITGPARSSADLFR